MAVYGLIFFHALGNRAFGADDGKIEMLSVEIRRKFAVSTA